MLHRPVESAAQSCPSSLALAYLKAATGKIHFHCRKAEGGHWQLGTHTGSSCLPIADTREVQRPTLTNHGTSHQQNAERYHRV